MLARIGFVCSNDNESLFRFVTFLECDGGSDLNHGGVDIGILHQDCCREDGFDLLDPSFKETLIFLGGVIIRIFGKVAHFDCVFQTAGNFIAPRTFQFSQFFL